MELKSYDGCYVNREWPIAQLALLTSVTRTGMQVPLPGYSATHALRGKLERLLPGILYLDKRLLVYQRITEHGI